MGSGARISAVDGRLPGRDLGAAGDEPGSPAWRRALDASRRGRGWIRPQLVGAYRSPVSENQAMVAIEPWLRPAADVAGDLGADVEQGLTSEGAAARLERHGPHQLDLARPAPPR